MPSPSHLVLDIETVLDPALPIADPGETDRLPPPPHHQIVVLGVMWLDREYAIRRLGVIGEGRDEASALSDLASFLSSHQPQVITYNGRGFDLPVIAARCLRHGVPLRWYYQQRDVRYRYSDQGHLDLLDFMSDFGAAARVSLDVAAKLCGMPGKAGMDGKDVGPMVHAGRLEDVRNYCLCDVVQTAAVFLRLQMLRGEVAQERYVAAMKGLTDLVDADDRVAQLRGGMDRGRLLLERP